MKLLFLEDRRACGAGGGGEPKKGGLVWITGLEGQAKAVALYLVRLGE